MDLKITAKTITLAGFLVAFAVIFQSSPVLLPGIGMLLSPFSSLPTALAAMISLKHGLLAFISAVVMLLFISLEEAMIFLFATGLLGLAIGTSIQSGFLKPLVIASISLSAGISMLTYIVGVPAFSGLSYGISIPLVLLFYLVFALCYSFVWILLMKKFVVRRIVAKSGVLTE